MSEFPVTKHFSIRAKDMIERLQQLDPEAHIITQLIPQDGEHVWNMWLDLSNEIEHFKWDAPVHQLKVWHPEFKTLPQTVEDQGNG